MIVFLVSLRRKQSKTFGIYLVVKEYLKVILSRKRNDRTKISESEGEEKVFVDRPYHIYYSESVDGKSICNIVMYQY
jgi:hypothetical protein